MKHLYILLLCLPSGFGRLTQKMTHYKYTHVALSLDESYTHFYAFSRLRAKTPPISGYIEEKRIYYTLGENILIYKKTYPIEHGLRPDRFFFYCLESSTNSFNILGSSVDIFSLEN